MCPFTEATTNWLETNPIDIGANKQCFAPNLLFLKLIKCNHRNWSRFKQTLKKSPHKPSASYTIDRFEKRSDCGIGAAKPMADDRAEARGTTNNELGYAVVLLC